MNLLEHLGCQGGCRSVCPAKQDDGAGRAGPIPQPRESRARQDQRSQPGSA